MSAINPPITRRSPRMGTASLTLFVFAPLVVWISLRLGGTDEFGGLGVGPKALLQGAVFLFLSVVAALGSLARRESWPALPWASLMVTIALVVWVFVTAH